MKPSKLPTIAVRRLRRIASVIKSVPKLYDQGSPGRYVAFGEGAPALGRVDQCDTPQCLLGWANTLFPEAPDSVRNALARAHAVEGGYDCWQLCGRGPESRVTHAAARLHITVKQAERLWTTGEWPQPFRNKHYNLLTDKAHANNAAKRIEHFIETGGAE